MQRSANIYTSLVSLCLAEVYDIVIPSQKTQEMQQHEYQ